MSGGRLGERLLAAGAISEEQLEEALEAQVVHGGRLGTNLIEHFRLDLDEIAVVLAEQRGLPAALQEHFDAADHAVQQALSAELAARWHVVPLGVVGSAHQRIAVAARDPLPAEAIDELTIALGLELVPAIACELRIFYQLESVYGIARPNRFKRVRHSASIDIPIVFEDAPADEQPPAAPAGRERRRFVTTLSDVDEPSDGVLGRIRLRRSGPNQTRGIDPADLDAVMRAVRRANGRDAVGDLVVAAMREGFERAIEVGMILVVRDQTAVGWKGFVRGGGDDAVELVAVPLLPGVACTITDVHARGGPWVGPPRHPEGLDGRLFAALGTAPPAELSVLPVSIFDKIACLLYAHGAGLDPAAADSLTALAEALSAAFERLIRAAQR
ncbi:MAG TPA: hypothetical protein VL172_14375 [Kofleriaceae bacterium]|jgi:hypothetical protein|nr:hypothetical protein [Kofleriaceae bacterium]